jgi:hypothetical protein
MKVAQMMIKIAVLTVIVTVIDPLFFFGPCSAVSIAFSSIALFHILCTCEGGMTDKRCIYFSVSLFFQRQEVIVLANE